MVDKLRFFYIPHWMKVLAHAENPNMLDISKKADITYSHVFQIARAFEKVGYVTREKIGRERKMKLTEKGERIRGLCLEFIKETENDPYN